MQEARDLRVHVSFLGGESLWIRALIRSRADLSRE